MEPGAEGQAISRAYAGVLLFLAGLFAFRVFAQLIQFAYPVEFLPPYSAWHSGALPYGWLVGAQGVILGLCLRIVWKLNKGTIFPTERKGKILLTLGIIYLLGMWIRLIVGLTIAPDHYWFGALLPTVFHLVLASFLALYGRFHLQGSRVSIRTVQGQTL